MDLHALDRAGWPAQEGSADAQRKDGGMEPAILAWVLAELRLDLQGLLLLDEVDPVALCTFRDRLVKALQQRAFPQ